MSTVPGEVKALVERIHATSPQLVMEFAGAGALALWWLHSVGGSSRTVLEATDRYTPASLIEGVGFEPARFTSSEVAVSLARTALERAGRLAANELVFGLGLTATIATDRTKKGDHRAELAVADRFGVTRFGVTLEKGARDRLGEEELVSWLVLTAIADACGVLGVSGPKLEPTEQLEQEFLPATPVATFEAGSRTHLVAEPDGSLGHELGRGTAIFSGSFNPVHRGHWQLREAAQEKLGVPVAFELSLANAEKRGIDMGEARRRANQFLGEARLVIDRAPLFNEKARLFPGSTFVVGFDTAVRLVDPKFYGGSEAVRDEALDEIRRNGNDFLVAGRYRDDRFQTLDDLTIPKSAEGLFEMLSEEEFREDLSSSQLRETWGHQELARPRVRAMRK